MCTARRGGAGGGEEGRGGENFSVVALLYKNNYEAYDFKIL